MFKHAHTSCWYVLRINQQYSTHSPRTRASQHLRGWRDVGRLWHSNARNACPWPRQWKRGLSQCLCVASSYNLHVRHKVGFSRNLRSFRYWGPQAPVATFLCFFLIYLSHALLILQSAFCSLCSLVMIIMFPVLAGFFPQGHQQHTDTRIGLMHRSPAGCPPCTEMLGYTVQSQDIAMSSNEQQHFLKQTRMTKTWTKHR